MLLIDRRIPDGAIALRAGDAAEGAGMSKGARGLKGSTLGIVGLGSIGPWRRHPRAGTFGMHVKALRRPGRPASTEQAITDLGIELLDSLAELAAAVEHPLAAHPLRTRHQKHLRMTQLCRPWKPGSVLINTSRADIVDADALLKALNSGNLRAGLDVYPDEPGRAPRSGARPSRHPPRSDRNAPHRGVDPRRLS